MINQFPFERLVDTQIVKKFPAFMESDSSLSCTREPATGPCPESDASSLQLPTLFP
jgi:hypothetical protein